MLEIADRPKAARYEEWAVSLHRFFATKFRLRRARAERIKRTKKREPHVGNKRPILVEHMQHQERCLDRLMDALGVDRTDVRTLDRILHERPQPEWLVRGADNADRRLKRDNEQGICGCHLCEARKDDRKWNSGR